MRLDFKKGIVASRHEVKDIMTKEVVCLGFYHDLPKGLVVDYCIGEEKIEPCMDAEYLSDVLRQLNNRLERFYRWSEKNKRDVKYLYDVSWKEGGVSKKMREAVEDVALRAGVIDGDAG